MSTLRIIHRVVASVIEANDKRWVPEDLDPPKTFFSENDWWRYYKSYNPNMCHQCDFYGDIEFFNGTDIRLTFPYLEIQNEDLIYVWVHPNCTCELRRVAEAV